MIPANTTHRSSSGPFPRRWHVGQPLRRQHPSHDRPLHCPRRQRPQLRTSVAVSLRQVASANIVSPSTGVCRPDNPRETRLSDHCQPVRVFLRQHGVCGDDAYRAVWLRRRPANGDNGGRDRSASSVSRTSPAAPRAARPPLSPSPVRISPKLFTATSAPTVIPDDVRSAAVPIPPFSDRDGPAPSASPPSPGAGPYAALRHRARRRRLAGRVTGRCVRPYVSRPSGRSNSTAADNGHDTGAYGISVPPFLQPPHHACRRIEPIGAAPVSSTACICCAGCPPQ
jgi:hypothetical protein